MSEVAASPVRYSTMAILLHWLTALLVLAGVTLAWLLDSTGTAAERNAMLAIHKSVGIAIFGLAWIRIGWRLTHAAPPLPAPQPWWQRLAAWATHVALYLITLTMPISGYASVAARGRDTAFFGLFTLPKWVPLDRSLSTLTEEIHEWSSLALYALVTLHLGAVLYHQMVQEDGLLDRMWPEALKFRAPVDKDEMPVSADY